MSIEIDVLNGDASWPRVEPLMKAVWPRHVVEKLSWGHVEWAHADLRVLIDAPEESPKRAGLPCRHLLPHRDLERAQGQHRRYRRGCDPRGLPRTRLRQRRTRRRDPDHARPRSAVDFALLFCEPHNFAFYQARGWHPFTGEVYAEQPGGTNPFRGDGAVRVRHFAAPRATAPSTYAACRGDPCAAMGGLRPRRPIICYS